MSNRKPAGPATKSKNRQVFRVAIGAALCCSVLLGSATAQVVVNPVNGHSYEYVRVRGYISWGAAKVWASSQDGYLATVTDATEARLVAGLLTAPGQKAFLGASDINDSCDWLWVTGEPFLYTDWAPGEPSGEEPCENSLRTSYELGGKWEADVSPLDGYIVEWDFFHSDTLTDFHQWKVSDGGNGHWYALLPDGMPWVQARDLAGQFNQNGTFGHLATITSEAENLFIADNIVSRIPAPDDRVDPVWLGGYDDSAWVWITGEPFSYTNWGLYEPDSAANAALAMIASSQWGSDYNAWLAESRDSHWRSVIEFDTEPASDTLLNLVQWPVSEGGNGHWYAYLPSTLSWDQARAAAVRFEKDGVAGHLATVTSEAENSFIFENIVTKGGLFERPLSWLGGYGDTLWSWVTGESFIYTKWGYGQPSYNATNKAVAMVGPPWFFCLNCPHPREWVAPPKDMPYSSIVEFDSPPIEPRTLLVPEEYPTIQIAINAAHNGDRVLVSPGTYYESIDFRGKNITVRGADGPLHTTITNERTVNLVTFDQGETHEAKLEGFTLSGGWIAVLCVNSAPTISRNICVRQNVWNWAAICLSGPLDTIVDPSGDPRYGASLGHAPAVIVNNTIVNSANGGVYTWSLTAPTIRNNIVAFNANYGIAQQTAGDQGSPIVGYNDVYGQEENHGTPHGNYINIPDPGPGSISADPLLCRGYELTVGSPCIDAGDPNPRFNDPDGSRNDMGAVPYLGGPGEVVVPTNEWIVVYCSRDFPDMPGPLMYIQAYDPDGVLCGQSEYRVGNGNYGLMPIYRDDPYTEIDEGCQPGDLIQFKIDGMPVQPSTPVYWTANGDVFEVCDFGANRCLDIPLHTGWNLISWNVAFESSIQLALDEIMGCVDVVHSYEQGGLTFDPQLDLYNTLTHVDYHHGYWIRMNCDAVLQVCGDEIGPAERIGLEPGWNLVSYWPQVPFSVEDGFVIILDHLNEAMGFDNGAQVWLPGMGPLNTLTELRPTFGYWTKVDEAHTLTYPPFGGGLDPGDFRWPADSGSTAPPLTETSRSWMSVYGDNITIDGRPLAEGAVVSFCTNETVTCGRGIYQGGVLRLTPLYGHDGSGEVSKLYPNDGDELAVFVDGQRVYPDLQWSSNGARVRLGRLTADSRGLPQEYALAQNYPNPFNPGTMIAFDVPSDGHVNVSIFNVLGQKVRTLVDRDCPAGRYEQEWDGRDDNGSPISTGVYFYRLTAGEQVLTKKMMLLK